MSKHIIDQFKFSRLKKIHMNTIQNSNHELEDLLYLMESKEMWICKKKMQQCYFIRLI